MVICALIMAGGKGERFWPVSTEKKPKQFLNLVGVKKYRIIAIGKNLNINKILLKTIFSLFHPPLIFQYFH